MQSFICARLRNARNFHLVLTMCQKYVKRVVTPNTRDNVLYSLHANIYLTVKITICVFYSEE